MTTPNQSPNQSPTQSRTTAGDEKSHTTPWVIVMRRELMVKLTDKGFLFGTLFTLLLIGGFLGYLLFGSDFDDGALQASGIIGSIIGAIIALLAYVAIRNRSGHASSSHVR
mgnify:CR=1 FL=1